MTHSQYTDLYKGQVSLPKSKIDPNINNSVGNNFFYKKKKLMKWDDEPYLVTCNIQNPTLANSLKNAQELFQVIVKNRGIKTYDLSFVLARKIYRESPELRLEYKKMHKALKDCKVRDCIELAQTLSADLWYSEDLYSASPLWVEIGLKINSFMKVLTFKEKVKAFYSFKINKFNDSFVQLKDKLEDNIR